MTSKFNPDSPSWRRRKARPRRFISVTLTNDRHGTSYTFGRARWYRPLTRHQIQYCRQKLCPEGCCPGPLRIHGPQEVVVREGFDLAGHIMLTLEPIRRTL